MARVHLPSTRRAAVTVGVLVATAVSLLPAARAGGEVACAAVLAVGLAALAGVELAPRGRAVPRALGLVVALPAALLGTGDAALVVAMAVVAATGASWVTRRDGRARARMLVVAAPAAALAVLVLVAGDGDGSGAPGVGTAALAAVIAFELVAACGGPGGRAAALLDVPWVVPAAAAVVAAGLFPHAAGVSPLAAPIGVVALVALVVWWGLPPWPSRVLARAGAASQHRGRRVLLVLVVAASVALAVAAAAPDSPSGLGAGALVAAELALVLASAGARQWLLVPRRRTVAAWLPAMTAIAVVAAAPDDGALVVAAVVTALVALGSGLGPARLGDTSARRAARSGTPRRPMRSSS